MLELSELLLPVIVIQILQSIKELVCHTFEDKKLYPKVHPYALETAYQWLKHFVYVYYGCWKQSEVDISLKHDVMTSFPLLKWTWIPISGANLDGVMVKGCTHLPLRQHTNSSNTLYMCNMDVWSGLRWISASNMTLWHHFCSSSEPESPNLGATWPE